MKLQSSCQICQKDLKLAEEVKFGDGWFRSYKCGHSFFETTQNGTAPEVLPPEPQELRAAIGPKKAFPFQVDGVQFIKKTNYNCLIADPMGLGKTIQALLAARESKERFKTVLVIVKSATIYQWAHESKEWYDPGLWSTFIIQGSKGWIPHGFSLYVISMDTLSRFNNEKNGGLKKLHDLNVDLVIVDECHSFKNPESSRSQALVAFLRNISQTEIEREVSLSCDLCRKKSSNELTHPAGAVKPFTGSWTEKTKIKINLRGKQQTISYTHQSHCPQCKSRVVKYQDQIVIDERECSKGLILLSGTPIKNRADEYFIPLNLLRPDVFTSLDSFRHRWLDQDDVSKKWNRIKPWKLESFRELTKDFILRREKNEVLSLPPFRRAFQTVSTDDPLFIKTYNKALEKLQSVVDAVELEGKEISWSDVDACLMTLRKIIGNAKTANAIEYVEEFLETVEDEKLAIGIHHESVRDTLHFELQNKGIKCLKLSGEDSSEQKDRILRKFNEDPSIRILIVNMIAGGVGLNIQVANNVLVLERQWNAADEEQFEGRFYRHGQNKPVLCEYMIATGIPIEDYFNALVEQKRQICGESLDGWDFRSDKDALKDLVYRTLASKLKGGQA